MSKKQIVVRAVEEIVARKRNKLVRPPELVEWDRRNGKRLLGRDWDDRIAAKKWRVQRAREILWALQVVSGKTRVRAMYNLKAADNDGRRGYVKLQDIIENGQLKFVVSELRMRQGNLLLQYEFLGQPIQRLRTFAETIFDEIAQPEETNQAA